MTDSVVFYRSFYESLQNLEPNERLIMYESIFRYAFEDAEPELQGVSNIAWILIKPQLDANISRRKNGEKGGRPRNKPKVSEEETIGYENNKPMVKPKVSEEETIGYEDGKPMVKPNVNVNVNDNGNGNGKENKKKKSVVDSPPSRDEVRDYVRKNNLAIDADAFFDYFTEMEWVDSNGNNVRSWKGKARTWDGFKKEQPKKPQPFIDEGGFGADLDMIEKLQGGSA